MPFIIPAAFALVGSLLMPFWADNCHVDHVEAATGGLNVYMKPPTPGEAAIFSVSNGNGPDDFWLTPNSEPGVPLYLAVGRRAKWLDADNTCVMTVETENGQTVLYLWLDRHASKGDAIRSETAIRPSAK